MVNTPLIVFTLMPGSQMASKSIALVAQFQYQDLRKIAKIRNLSFFL